MRGNGPKGVASGSVTAQPLLTEALQGVFLFLGVSSLFAVEKF